MTQNKQSKMSSLSKRSCLPKVSKNTVAVRSSVGRAFHVAGPHTMNARRPRTVLVRWLSLQSAADRGTQLSPGQWWYGYTVAAEINWCINNVSLLWLDFFPEVLSPPVILLMPTRIVVNTYAGGILGLAANRNFWASLISKCVDWWRHGTWRHSTPVWVCLDSSVASVVIDLTLVTWRQGARPPSVCQRCRRLNRLNVETGDQNVPLKV